MRVLIYLFLFLFFVALENNKAQDNLYLGGGVALVMPSNNFGTKNFGFNTVAATGYGANANLTWFYRDRLSLNGELQYSDLPMDKDFWNKIRKYGQIDVSYQMLSLTIQGNYYFSDDELRPYIGIGTGAYYINNDLDFNSNYVGTTGDESVNYNIKLWRAGILAETGLLLELSRTTLFCLGFNYTIIPNINTKEKFGADGDVIVRTPIENQDHWRIVLKLLFKL